MNKKIRLGVIGIGFAWDRLHYPVLQKLTDKYEIAAVCDIAGDKAQGFASGIGLGSENIYTDYNKLLLRTDIDAVDLLVPISENYNIAKDIIKSGKNLIAEKPFASTPEAAKELIELKNQNNVTVLVAENFRYDEENNIIKDIISNATIGEVMYFIQNTGADFEKDMIGDTFSAKEWRQHPEFAGGIFLDGGIHDIARMRFLFGDVDTLYAAARPQEEGYCPYMSINALLKFKNNISGHYSYYSQGMDLQKPPVGLRIFGTLGDIYLESKDKGVIEIFYKDGCSEQRNFTPAQGYYYELLNFYNAVNSGDTIVSTPEKEAGDIELVFDILKSIQNNELIKK